MRISKRISLLMSPQNKFLIVIAGPTAVGKTSLAIDLAKEFHSEIISADSRQFFREINIGTAKPSDEDLKKVKHHFINSLSIEKEYNAAQFAEDAEKLLTELFKKINIVFLVGGSGLYIDALCKGFDKIPKGDDKTRKKLNDIFENEGISALRKMLKEKDAEYYEKVDLKNPHRLIRALEVCLQTGKPYSSFRKSENKIKNKKYSIIKIGLTLPKEELHKRIDERVDKMIADELLEEVNRLYEYKNLNPLQTVGYKEFFYFLDEQINFTEAVELIKRNTRQFAKRQMTWFKKDKEIKWFSPYEKEAIVEHIKKNCL